MSKFKWSSQKINEFQSEWIRNPQSSRVFKFVSQHLLREDKIVKFSCKSLNSLPVVFLLTIFVCLCLFNPEVDSRISSS